MGDISVKYFDSTMTGAPVITTATAGSLIDMLYQCLVTGFGQVTLTSLVVTDGWAIATVNTGHGFTEYVPGLGPVVRVAGATPAGLNGDWRVEVLSSTQIRWAVTGISNQTATGTITATRAPAGWTREFAGTNKAVFRGNPITGSGWHFRVQHDISGGNASGAVIPYRTMSDVDTGTRQALYAYISLAYQATGTTPWALIADDRTVWLRYDERSSGAYVECAGFGDFAPATAGDADCAFVSGYAGLAGGMTDFDAVLGYYADGRLSLASGLLDQVSRAGQPYFPLIVRPSLSGYHLPATAAGDTAYPNPLTNLCDAAPIAVLESGYIRGTLRGIQAPQHARGNLPTNQAYPLAGGRVGKVVLIEAPNPATNRYGALFVDLTGPW